MRGRASGSVDRVSEDRRPERARCEEGAKQCRLGPQQVWDGGFRLVSPLPVASQNPLMKATFHQQIFRAVFVFVFCFFLDTGRLEGPLPVSPRMGLQGAFCFPLGLLFGSVLLAASAPAALESPDCSDKEQQVTVSHTYRIDMPKSALVQVEAAPPPSGDDGASLLAPGEADEQNIIFRHNIRLQTPPKDCALAGLVQDLLGRVKKLEEEVAEVKGQCDPQRCCQGAAGELSARRSLGEPSVSTFSPPVLRRPPEHSEPGALRPLRGLYLWHWRQGPPGAWTPASRRESAPGGVSPVAPSRVQGTAAG